MKSHVTNVMAGLAFVVLCAVAGHASADTAADLARVESHLRRAQVNLDSVNASIGQRTTPPTGSSAKLAKVRLDQAFADLEPAGKLLETLPADGAGVADVAEKYNAAVQLYQKLAGILTGESAPPQNEPVEGEVRLGYPHADNFKNAQFTYAHKVQAPAAALAELKTQMEAVDQPLTINHRATAGAIAQIAEARRQAGFVEEALGKLPANGQGVAAAKRDLADSLKQIEDVEAYVAPLHERIMATIDPAKYPQFDEDRKRLQGLSGDYRQEWIFTENRARAAELLGQRQAAQEELARVVQAYYPLIQQQTEMGQAMGSVASGALRSLEGFDAKIVEQKEALPGSIREDLAQADKAADEAVQNQRPLWFTGGIPQRMGWAQDKLALLKAIDAEVGAEVEAELVALQASLKTRADALKELIIRENPLPGDQYAGEDREEVVQVARSAWAVQQDDAQVLAVRIPAQAWSRETKWTYSNGTWYFSDKSKLQVRLIVADHDNPDQAIDRPVTVIKNHEAGDTMIGVPMRSFDEALEPGEYLLRDKIK